MPQDKHSTCECWRPVTGWANLYEISCQGRLFSRRSKRILKATPVGAGYPSLRLCDSPRRDQAYLHHLVAEAFLDPQPEGCEPNHRNGQKADNRAANLEWLTHSQNLKHAWSTGLYRTRAQEGQG